MICCGESGSGKTESTYAMRLLVPCARLRSNAIAYGDVDHTFAICSLIESLQQMADALPGQHHAADRRGRAQGHCVRHLIGTVSYVVRSPYTS